MLLVSAWPALAAWDVGAYHDRAEVRAVLEAAARSDRSVTVATIGRSAGGHPIQVLTIARPGEVDPAQRPAVFVGANIEGYFNGGTEAALDLIESLLDGSHDDLLKRVTFHVAPVLNPDAHDGMFSTPRVRRRGNGQSIDYDRDGLVAEDDYEDLDGDGRITSLRVQDPAGGWQPHPDDPRVMVRGDSSRGWAAGWAVHDEGADSDGDGSWNEDPAEGTVVNMNFAHVFPYPDAKAGPWASYAPEAKAIMDWLLERKNLALAIVYGPANNLLETPRSLGGGGDLGTQTFTLTEEQASMIGLETDVEYSMDEIWEVARTIPFVQQNNISKEQVAQFLGAGPATKLEDADVELLGRHSTLYKEILESAGLPTDRPVQQYDRGGFTPWLYYHYGVPVYELDVWGIPKAEKASEEETRLTVEGLENMSADEFVALDEAAIAAFLEEIGAPPQFTAGVVLDRVRSGQVTPKEMAGMIRQMGGGSAPPEKAAPGEDDAKTKRMREILVWVERNVPEAWAPWTPVTLPDGTKGEAGGLDPFILVAPPLEILEPAMAAHTKFIVELAGKLPRIGIRSVEVDPLGSGVYRVRAVASNQGEMATHSAMAKRSQSRLPVRMTLEPSRGVELIAGKRAVVSERLEPHTGLLEATWLLRTNDPRDVVIRLTSDGAGSDERTIRLERNPR